MRGWGREREEVGGADSFHRTSLSFHACCAGLQARVHPETPRNSTLHSSHKALAPWRNWNQTNSVIQHCWVRHGTKFKIHHVVFKWQSSFYCNTLLTMAIAFLKVLTPHHDTILVLLSTKKKMVTTDIHASSPWQNHSTVVTAISAATRLKTYCIIYSLLKITFGGWPND